MEVSRGEEERYCRNPITLNRVGSVHSQLLLPSYFVSLMGGTPLEDWALLYISLGGIEDVEEL